MAFHVLHSTPHDPGHTPVRQGVSPCATNSMGAPRTLRFSARSGDSALCTLQVTPGRSGTLPAFLVAFAHSTLDVILIPHCTPRCPHSCLKVRGLTRPAQQAEPPDSAQSGEPREPVDPAQPSVAVESDRRYTTPQQVLCGARAGPTSKMTCGITPRCLPLRSRRRAVASGRTRQTRRGLRGPTRPPARYARRVDGGVRARMPAPNVNMNGCEWAGGAHPKHRLALCPLPRLAVREGVVVEGQVSVHAAHHVDEEGDVLPVHVHWSSL
eukprot:gene11762-biopygen876